MSLTTLSYSQVSLTSLNTAYTQNFDGLANSGTSSTTLNGTLAGWYILETGSNSNTTYTVGTGSATAGDTYSFGATSSTERALGSIASSKLLSKYGAQFKNDTGNTIDQLQISYVGEEWRFDPDRGTTIKDQITFEYSTDATSLTTGTWTAVTALLYETTNLTGTVGTRNGNDAAYRTSLSNTITGLNISAGQTFWVRFSDINISGTDDGLAVDDFSLTPQNSSFLSVNDTSKTKNIFLKNTMVDNTLSFQAKGNATVRVYNTNGQLVKSATISAQNANVNVANLPKGNYVVTAELNGETVSQKILKK
ncbi:T9SS type A sorting domain-containing protein [Cloacibacterium normanense]